jgi:hypothetical protein
MHLKLQFELELSEILALVTGLPNLSVRGSRALAPLSSMKFGRYRGDLSKLKAVP